MVLTKAARWPLTVLLGIITVVITGVAITSGLAIQANTDRLENVVHEQCEAGQNSARGINTVLETLIDAVTLTNSIPQAEKADRVRKYQAAMQPIPVCAKPE